MNIKTSILIIFIIPLAYILFGYRENEPLPKPETVILKEHEKPNKVKEKELVLIEINSIPPPFDVAGNNPYVLWVNGCRIDMSKKDLIEFVNKIGMENIEPMQTSDIHKGWIQPHFFESINSNLQ